MIILHLFPASECDKTTPRAPSERFLVFEVDVELTVVWSSCWMKRPRTFDLILLGDIISTVVCSRWSWWDGDVRMSWEEGKSNQNITSNNHFIFFYISSYAESSRSSLSRRLAQRPSPQGPQKHFQTHQDTFRHPATGGVCPGRCLQ